MDDKSLLIIITGPSGSGKGTVIKAIMNRFPGITRVVTYTTRDPRQGERHGVDYLFVSHDDFFNKVKNEEIFEYESVYNDYYYGSPANPFHNGMHKVMEVDYKGHRKYKQRFPQAVSIFIMPPSLKELKERIEDRAKEKNLEARLLNAIEQMRYAPEYDYIVKNHDLKSCLEKIFCIISAELTKRDRQDLLAEIRQMIAASN